MERLFSFLENFDAETLIRICSESGDLLFDGKAGDIPQRVTNMSKVIKGSVVNDGSRLIVKIKKC